MFHHGRLTHRKNFSDLCYSLMLHRCILIEDLDTAFTSGITSTADPTANANGGSDLSLSGLLTSLDSAEGRCIIVFHSRPRFR